jgi:eukaryotic-like serine/threonine-protein kinase
LLFYAAGATAVRGRELVWVTRDGVATPVDSEWTLAFTDGPAISPDGKTVAIGGGSATGKSQLWVKQLDHGPATKLADAGSWPAWSPDGKMIVFVSGLAIERIPADGSALPTKIFAGPADTRKVRPEYSHDAEWLVFSNANKKIVGRRTDADSAVRELVTDAAVVTRFALSPDGRWLAYDSDETGRMEVHVRPFPDTKTASHEVSIGGGASPRWSRDGRELFFVDEHLDLIAVPVTLSPTFSAGTPHRLFAASAYLPASYPFDVSPDGRRFLMSRPVGGGSARPDELILVQNAFEELKARVKAKR